jgi:hypothetical protein
MQIVIAGGGRSVRLVTGIAGTGSSAVMVVDLLGRT